MIAEEDDHELKIRRQEGPLAAARDATDKASFDLDTAAERVYRPRLPWIGALENPRLGPMVVLNENGYLVPLLTAGDLLRGFKYYWHRSQL